MPDVVGLASADATAAIGALGGRAHPLDLVPQLRVAYDASVPSGRVAAETPSGGATLSTTSHVLLTISLGPQTAPGASTCQPDDLKVTSTIPVNPEAGQNPFDVGFTNVSSSTCVLSGYPTVAFADASGKSVGFTVSHAGAQVTSASPSAVYLLSGGTTWVRLNKYRCDVATLDTATTVILSLPSTGGAFRVTVPGLFTYCNEGASLTVAVSPFEPAELPLNPAHSS